MRNTGEALKIFRFESTGDAYDACQCDSDIHDGDILVIPDEGVIGIADTWPVAITVNYGKLHTPALGFSLADVFERRIGNRFEKSIALARRVARKMKLEVRA